MLVTVVLLEPQLGIFNISQYHIGNILAVCTPHLHHCCPISHHRWFPKCHWYTPPPFQVSLYYFLLWCGLSHLNNYLLEAQIELRPHISALLQNSSVTYKTSTWKQDLFFIDDATEQNNVFPSLFLFGYYAHSQMVSFVGLPLNSVYLGIALQHLQSGSMKKDRSCLCYIPVVKILHQYSGHCQSE